MYLTILRGLPVRILRASNKHGEQREFKVGTETVQRIIEPIIDDKHHIPGLASSEIVAFDEEVMYYVPDDVFTFPKDTEVLKYINMNIDDYWEL